MKVILLERIEKLGQMGDEVTVKSGFARNYLLPHKKALRATKNNKKYFDSQRAQLEASNLDRRSDAEKLGEKLDGLFVSMVRQAGESGQLYGSVNARDIAVGITEAGFTVTRQQVELAHPIKMLGLFDVHVSLHPEVNVTVIANVARSEDEAKTQSKTGKAVVSTDEEEVQAAKEAAEEAAAAAEAAADEAVADQAEDIFEEGAAPQPDAEEDADGDAGAGAGADADASEESDAKSEDKAE